MSVRFTDADEVPPVSRGVSKYSLAMHALDDSKTGIVAASFDTLAEAERFATGLAAFIRRQNLNHHVIKRRLTVYLKREVL